MKKFSGKESGINQIVGAENAEQESLLLEYFSDKLKEPIDQESEKIEYQKSPELRELIEETIKCVSEFLAQYGIEAVKISADKIFIYDFTKLSQEQKDVLVKKFGKDAGAVHFPSAQKIVVLKDVTSLFDAKIVDVVAHELIHLNSFHSYEKTSEPSESGTSLRSENSVVHLKMRRAGLNVGTKNKESYFNYTNEAVTEELAARFCDQFFPLIKGLEDVAAKKEEYVQRYFPPEKQDKARVDILQVRTHQLKDGEWETTIFDHAYSEERQKLNKIIDELWERNKDKFASREDIFNLFADATLKGRLLPLARLIEKSYSKGFFRHLGEISTGKNEENKEK